MMVVTEQRPAKLDSESMSRQRMTLAFLGIVFAILSAVAAFALAEALFGRSWVHWLAGAVALSVMIVPTSFAILIRSERQADEFDAVTARREAALREAVERADHEASGRERQARHQEFESRLLNALEMAEAENEVLDVVCHAFAMTLPERPVELLLADNSHAHLIPVASGSRDAGIPGCPVDSPDDCPAARRAQVQRFPDSEALDACPKLRDRPNGSCAAVCVPVSIVGRTVGVIHATGEVGWTMDDDAVTDLQTLAKQSGARLGLLRIMAETQLQAQTDGLTGLANRRTVENQIHALRRRNEPFALAMIDLDLFKKLNDTLGHETGDRALRLFAHTLRESVRAEDLVCRYGGEEFAVVFPGATVEVAVAVLERVRDNLRTALQRVGMPAFTASYGVVEAVEDEDMEDVFSRADALLFDAKRGGRDRVVFETPVRPAAAEPESEVEPVTRLHA